DRALQKHLGPGVTLSVKEIAKKGIGSGFGECRRYGGDRSSLLDVYSPKYRFSSRKGGNFIQSAAVDGFHPGDQALRFDRIAFRPAYQVRGKRPSLSVKDRTHVSGIAMKSEVIESEELVPRDQRHRPEQSEIFRPGRTKHGRCFVRHLKALEVGSETFVQPWGYLRRTKSRRNHVVDVFVINSSEVEVARGDRDSVKVVTRDKQTENLVIGRPVGPEGLELTEGFSVLKDDNPGSSGGAGDPHHLG